jgi:hypothetical protein
MSMKNKQSPPDPHITRSGELNPGGAEYDEVRPHVPAGTDTAVGPPSAESPNPGNSARQLDAREAIAHHPELDRPGGPRQAQGKRSRRAR